MTQFRIIQIGVALLALVVMSSCNDDKQAKLVALKKQQQELAEDIARLEAELKRDGVESARDEGVKVVTLPVVRESFAHYIEVHGKLDGDENLQVYPKGQGVVTRVMVKTGDAVRKGQIIALLDDGALRKSYDQTKVQYDLANDVFVRQQRLWEQKIGSEMQYLQAKSQKEALESALAGLKEQLSYMQIQSPIDGNVEDLPLKVGMAVSPAMPVATVINFASLKVVADVAEAYSSSIMAGDSVMVSFPDIQMSLNSTIASASKYINPVNRSFKVEVRLPSAAKGYKANMIAVLKIADYRQPSAFVMPVNLIQTDSRGNYVMLAVPQDGGLKARKQYIKQGVSYNGLVEIVDGLQENQQVITVGFQGLTDGTLLSQSSQR
ncbi:RND family efflux transporter MFP subunit [Breznakibacter xylanolyticus]|uniref:RND family efflux transporter MFP subunit n=1 Tax=Breznakibacter xylanolyticus TaxID=990 RepID=A0A2W7PVV1_9BACT|nr:efflux RND transporter periplasmic adaptor subunit [Breznakibacter xylanolyticus]PZX13709.1 RND family efflux transporter MFP subunit [Breznakibacter xylanolyticus]